MKSLQCYRSYHYFFGNTNCWLIVQDGSPSFPLTVNSILCCFWQLWLSDLVRSFQSALNSGPKNSASCAWLLMLSKDWAITQPWSSGCRLCCNIFHLHPSSLNPGTQPQQKYVLMPDCSSGWGRGTALRSHVIKTWRLLRELWTFAP